MFESICIHEQAEGPGDPLDLGFLAEALLFYQNVRVAGHGTALRQIVPAFGPDVLFEFLQRGYLSITYLQELSGIHTRQTGSVNESHFPTAFAAPEYQLQNYAPKIFAEVTGRSERGRRLAARFIHIVETTCHDQNVLDATSADILAVTPVEEGFREILRVLAPEYEIPQPLITDVQQIDERFHLSTNIDFVQANQSYHKRIPPSHSSLTVAFMLSLLLKAREHMHFASRFGSEIASSRINASLLKFKVDSLVRAHDKNRETVSKFQDFIFDEGRTVREAINSGEKSFKDVLKIIEKAEKFKAWLKDQRPDAELCKEYHRAVTSQTWVDKLPSKTLRWLLFTGIGVGIDMLGAGGIGTAAGVGISAAEQLILDRLLKGWKPSQFVKGPLQDFVNRK